MTQSLFSPNVSLSRGLLPEASATPTSGGLLLHHADGGQDATGRASAPRKGAEVRGVRRGLTEWCLAALLVGLLLWLSGCAGADVAFRERVAASTTGATFERDGTMTRSSLTQRLEFRDPRQAGLSK